MGMRLCYVSVPHSAIGQLRSDPNLAPSLLVERALGGMAAAAPAGFQEALRKQLGSVGLGGLFPRLMRGNDDEGGSGDSPGQSLLRPDAVRGELEKSWHALHFMFSGKADDAPPPLGLLCTGGEEVSDDLGYGPARYLSPPEVVAFRDVLRAIDDAEFDRRFDLAAFERNDLYPNIWDEDRDDLLEEYRTYFEQLCNDLDATVAAGEGLLIGIE